MNRLSTRLRRLEVGTQAPAPCIVLFHPRAGRAAALSRFQVQLDEAIRGGGRVIVGVADDQARPPLPHVVEVMTPEQAYRELLNCPAPRMTERLEAALPLTSTEAEAVYRALMLDEVPA